MKIVDRKTFLTLPAGTVFAKFNPHVIEDLEIKGDTWGNDYLTETLRGDFEGAECSDTYFQAMERAMTGAETPIEYGVMGRDGLFDADQLFAVWSAEDTRRLIARLQEAIEEQPSPAPTISGAFLRLPEPTGTSLHLELKRETLNAPPRRGDVYGLELSGIPKGRYQIVADPVETPAGWRLLLRPEEPSI